MRNGNPHAPSKAWLHSIAYGGGYNESEPGDKGTSNIRLEDGTTFRVTVENTTDE